jgi:murein DD-endopeptidase MepM/ murein hydrolase activator NlpD
MDDKRMDTVPDFNRDEQRRLKRLEREARREARRRQAAGNADALSSAASRSRTLRSRFLRVTALATAALLVGCTLLPPFLIPVDGATSSRFFIRNAPDSPRLFDFEHHTGLDIAAPEGARVGATRSGRVVAAGTDPSYGRYVDVRHLFGWTSRYAHLSKATVREGQLVLRGGKLGEAGMTGRATGPHLHFEIRAAGRALPPGLFLVFHRVRRLLIRGR